MEKNKREHFLKNNGNFFTKESHDFLNLKCLSTSQQNGRTVPRNIIIFQNMGTNFQNRQVLCRRPRMRMGILHSNTGNQNGKTESQRCKILREKWFLIHYFIRRLFQTHGVSGSSIGRWILYHQRHLGSPQHACMVSV